MLEVYLSEQLWGGVCCQDGWGHVLADSVQLLDLSFPHVQQPLPTFIYSLAANPFTLQAEREARLLLLMPEITQRSTGNIIENQTQDRHIRLQTRGLLERDFCDCFGCHGDMIGEVLPGGKEADWDSGVKLQMHYCLMDNRMKHWSWPLCLFSILKDGMMFSW